MGERSHDQLSEDEVMAGGIVWVCEHGHVDVAHKTEDNYLDLCMRCKNGVCVPKKTLGRRSKAQRKQDRELGLDTSRRRGEPSRQEAPVRVVRPESEPELVDAGSLRPRPVQAFILATDVRNAIVAGKTPRISFPRQPPDDHPADKPYPAAEGDVVAVAVNLLLVVCGLRTLIDEIVIEYEVRDLRPATAGDEGRFATSKETEKPTERMGGPEFRAEREPERLPAREVAKLAARVHESELRKLRRTREDLGRHLSEQPDAPSDFRHGLKLSIRALDRRIENIEAEMEDQAA
jgi:hypothetical protein